MLSNYGVEKTLESPLDCREIKPVNPKGDQSWVFIGRTDAEAETPVLWPPHAKSWLIGKDPDAGKDWRQEESGEGNGTPLQYFAWKIPWMEKPGGLQSMGSLRVGHDWATSLSLFTIMHWRRKWQPTPVFLPGESQGRGAWWLPSVGSHRVRHDWSDLTAGGEGDDRGLDGCMLSLIQWAWVWASSGI